jgi:hypothetical protein
MSEGSPVISQKDSNFEKARQSLRYHPRLILLGHDALMYSSNSQGAQYADFFVAPVKPDFTVKGLSKIQEDFSNELGIEAAKSFSPHEYSNSGSLYFGDISFQDILVRYARRTSATELEVGAAVKLGFDKDTMQKDETGDMRRYTLIRFYPHEYLAEIARELKKDEKEHNRYDSVLNSLITNISEEQLAILKRLTNTDAHRVTSYGIKDALRAKALEKELNDILRRNRNFHVSPQINIGM